MTPEKRDVYRPESGNYEGEILLETEDGRSIRLVRDFDTNRADVLNELGDDITWQYRDANGRFMLFGQDDTTLYEPRYDHRFKLDPAGRILQSSPDRRVAGGLPTVMGISSQPPRKYSTALGTRSASSCAMT